jgi:hypothetical protein
MTNSSLPLALSSVSIAEIYQAATGRAAGRNRASGGLLVRCPSSAHEDAHPSCLIKPDDGVWTCFSCNRRGGKLDIVIASGHARDRSAAALWLAHNLGRRRELQEQPKAERWSGDRAEKILVATHSYVDADAVLTEQILRYRVAGGGRTKSFLTRRPNGAGEWIYHHAARCERGDCPCRGSGPLANTVPPVVPYNLPSVIAAGAAGRQCLLVEGESDADVLTRLGFVASTNQHGVDFQYPAAWHRYFDAVSRWVVLCDSDEPGRRAAAERAAFLGPLARVVDLFPGDIADKHGRDVSDWRESLLTIFRAALACATR